MPIYKKGDKKKPENYRGITLSSTLSKMFTYLLNQKWANGVKITIFYLKHRLPINQEMNNGSHFCSENVARYAQQRMHLAFIAFSKAFDNVNKNLLYEKVISYGISSKFLKIIESM